MAAIRRLLFITLAGSLGVTSTGFRANVPVDTRSLDEIYAAAQNESGPLIVASGGDAQSQGDTIRNAWAQRFPRIPLNLTVDLSKYHDSRIDRAFYEKNENTDVALLQTLHDFPYWKEQNRLMYYKPATFNDIYNGEKDLDGAYYPILTFNFGRFIYDSTKLNASLIPKSYADLTDPRYKDKLVLTLPNDDDAILYLFHTIVSKYGFRWLDGLIANNPMWVRGTGTPTFVLQQEHNNATSKLALTITSAAAPANATYFHVKEPQAPEQYMSWTQTAAIFASTKRPNSAQLFISWLLSDEFQSTLQSQGRPIVRRSLDQGELYLSNTTQVDGFRVFMNDRRFVERWRLQFETSLGTAQGPSALTFVP
ncbi:periplasmic binding protein-like II [Rhizodiscina lignyota]|uniref:Periplasmic binding protein-like II n=1 Tax=Rhizodiscina lignyota TaxID=1504668 RepID=A0A9P4IP70_9PEZI|nr:periplasmic binding protein-like II [Rhizodiscina lignyota]